MSWFSRREKRDNDINIIKNPCPIPDKEDNTTLSLSNLMKQFKGSAMNLSPFFAGVNIISNSVAMMEWEYKDLNDNLLGFSHYLWHLFDNSKLTRFNIIKNLIQDIICHGNGFIYIERNEETGKPMTLHYSPAKETMLYYDDMTHNLFFLNLRYNTKWDNGDNYLHFFMQPDETGFKGAAIPEFAYKTIELANATEKSANDYYSSGGQLYGLITTNNETPTVGTRKDQIKNLRASWDEARSQSKGTGTIFVPADLKFQQLSSSAKDSALVESRLYNITEIARWLNISPVLLGDLSHTQYGSMQDAQADFLIHTLAPYVEMIEAQCNKKLIMPSRQGREYVDLDEAAILAVDKEKEASYYNSLVGGGIMTVNEARHRLGLPYVDGGDALIVPYTNIQDNTIGSTDEQPIDNQ